MIAGIYIGERADLKGEKALLRDDPNGKGNVLAQFDDRELDLGKQSLKECLAHGWTSFPNHDFRIITGGK